MRGCDLLRTGSAGRSIRPVPVAVAYIETIRRPATARRRCVNDRGQGAAADCEIAIAPLPRGRGIEFISEIKAGAVPASHIAAAKEGVLDALHRGPRGLPVADIEVRLIDGACEASRDAQATFREAAVLAARDAMESADLVVLEPIYRLSVTVDSSSAGDVMGDLNRRRGRLLASSGEGPLMTITADVPVSETLGLSSDLIALAGKSATHQIERTTYEELPPRLAEPEAGGGDGTSPTREPRRPRPQSGADAISLPRPDQADDVEPTPADVKRIV